MFEFLVLVRNAVLAGILAWLGLEFVPEDQDTPEQTPAESVASTVFGW